jgi:uncharacterized membrane protein
MRLRAVIPGMLFIAAGAMHFVRPAWYHSIVPPQLGHAAELVAISGVCEIAGPPGRCGRACRCSSC